MSWDVCEEVLEEPLLDRKRAAVREGAVELPELPVVLVELPVLVFVVDARGGAADCRCHR